MKEQVQERKLTGDMAIRMLNACKAIEEPTVDNRVEVSGVSLQTRDGAPHVWEESGERYAVVYFKAMTPWHVEEASRLLAEGNLQDAVNKRCSLRVPLEVGQGMLGPNGKVKPMLTATVGFDYTLNKNTNQEELRARKCFPNAYASSTTKVNFSQVAKDLGIEA